MSESATRPARKAPATPTSVIERSWAEPDAFAGLFERYADDIHRYVAGRLGADVAEDLMAETFVIAFQRRRRYDLSRPHARPWLYGIATNLVGRHRRTEARRLRALSRVTSLVADEGDDGEPWRTGSPTGSAPRAPAPRSPGRRPGCPPVTATCCR
ncbi:RNA polymerase sigma factor [Streptomyces sp. NPDC051636]|uniref:RNA polymerase sigma factor n=1 Tax=Streptomyces sp. NPDC051636 TaxID=3365663 RepID=UPI0037BBFF3A